MKEFLEKALQQNVVISQDNEIYKKLPLAYRGRYDIYKVETNGVLWLAIYPKARKDAGEAVDSSDIKKHKKDILRIAAELILEPVVDLPATAATRRKQAESQDAAVPDGTFGYRGNDEYLHASGIEFLGRYFCGWELCGNKKDSMIETDMNVNIIRLRNGRVYCLYEKN